MAATAPPDDQTLRPIWYAEKAVDNSAHRQPLPQVTAGGDTDFQRALIDRLQALGVRPGDARDWADRIVNGLRDNALRSQFGATPVAASVAPEPGTVVAAPLGGAVHEILREALTGEPSALNAAYDVAAHYLQHGSRRPVSRGDAAEAAKSSWPVVTLIEVVAVAYLAVREDSPVAVRQSMATLNAAAGPALQTFLATHGQVIRAAVVDDDASHVHLLDQLMNPSADPRDQRSADPSGADPAATTHDVNGPWHLPLVELGLATAPSPEVLAAGWNVAALLTELHNSAESTAAAESLDDATPAGRLRGLVESALARHPRLEDPAHELLRGAYQREVAHWLAPALAALRVDGEAPVSAQRVGEILSMARAVPAARTDWTAPLIAEALGGEWRETPAHGLWLLPAGTVTPLLVRRDDDPEHLLLSERTATGLTIIETVAATGVRVDRVTVPAEAAAMLRGHLRVVVDAADRIAAVTAGSAISGTVTRPPIDNPPLAGGLRAPNFGRPVPVHRPGAIPGVPGVSRFDAVPGTAVILVDEKAATIGSVQQYLAGAGPIRGILVLDGPPSPRSGGYGYRDMAHDAGLHTLEPVPSRFAEPVIVRHDDGSLVSSTGWRVEDPAGRTTIDHRGALSTADLADLHRGVRPVAVPLTPAETALVAEVNLRAGIHRPYPTARILDARDTAVLPLDSFSQLAARTVETLRGRNARLPGGAPTVPDGHRRLAVPPGPDGLLHALIAGDPVLVHKLLWPDGHPPADVADLAEHLADEDAVNDELKELAQNDAATAPAGSMLDRAAGALRERALAGLRTLPDETILELAGVADNDWSHLFHYLKIRVAQVIAGDPTISRRRASAHIIAAETGVLEDPAGQRAVLVAHHRERLAAEIRALPGDDRTLSALAAALGAPIEVYDGTAWKSFGDSLLTPFPLLEDAGGRFSGAPALVRVSAVADAATELDHEYGGLAGPKRIKPGERDEQGRLRLNPLWYRLEDFPPRLLDDRPGAHWQYLVDENGDILLGAEEITTVVAEDEWRQLAGAIARVDPDITVERLKELLDHQGHPTVAAGFDEVGHTVRRPARISGELSYDEATQRWVINNKSGRYMKPKVRKGMGPETSRPWTERVAARLQDHFGRPIAVNVVGAKPPKDKGIEYAGRAYWKSAVPAGPDSVLRALVAADPPLMGKLLGPDAELVSWLEDEEQVRKAITKDETGDRLTRVSELIRARVVPGPAPVDERELIGRVADELDMRILVLDDRTADLLEVIGTGRTAPVLLLRTPDGRYSGAPARAVVAPHRGATPLDRRLGELAGPKRVKGAERDDQGDVRVNPLWYPLSEFPQVFFDRQHARWHYAADENGDVFIGTEEIGTVLTEQEWTELATHTGRPVEELRAGMDGQGHPTVAPQFTEDGRATRRPLRVAGEISYNSATDRWEVNDKSGRYMSKKVRPDVPPEIMRDWVGAVVTALRARFTGITFEAVLLKHSALAAGAGVVTPLPVDPATLGLGWLPW
ncbi:hypothetical protein AB0J83_17460 [Actinoplanes sp. NPDC049596]|uniref:hypothetical protein n=1 Tax=unclassified Actinoplanes TaxID=2626549 RepID=UPI00341E2D41